MKQWAPIKIASLSENIVLFTVIFVRVDAETKHIITAIVDTPTLLSISTRNTTLFYSLIDAGN